MDTVTIRIFRNRLDLPEKSVQVVDRNATLRDVMDALLPLVEGESKKQLHYRFRRMARRKNNTKRPMEVYSPEDLDTTLVDLGIDRKPDLYLEQHEDETFPGLDSHDKSRVFLQIRLWDGTQPTTIGDFVFPDTTTVRELKETVGGKIGMKADEMVMVDEETDASYEILGDQEKTLEDLGIITGDVIHVEPFDRNFHLDHTGTLVNSLVENYYENYFLDVALAATVGELSDVVQAEIEEKMGKRRCVFDFPMGDAEAVFVAQRLRGNRNVEKLYLAGFYFGTGSVGARALAESLGEHNVTLKLLSTGHSFNGRVGTLARMLEKNATLETLDSRCTLNLQEVRALGDALKYNNTLKVLELLPPDTLRRSFSDDCAKALAEGLRWNESLTTLRLRYCKLTDVGAASLLVALQESNSTLTTLVFDYNSIKNDEIKASIKSLCQENKAVRPASAERRARCLLFCCLKLSPTAHEHVVPSIGAVPVPVVRYAVEHAGELHVAKRFEERSLDEQNKQLWHQNAQLQEQLHQLNAQLLQQNTQLNSLVAELDSARASLASHVSNSSGDEDSGEPANKRAKTH